MSSMPSILSISASDIQHLLAPVTAVDALAELLQGDFDPADDLHRASFALPMGSFLIMPSAAGDFAGIKIVTVSPDDPQRTAPRIQASYNLYDAHTLTQIALFDGTELTSLRTPAVSMLAIRPFLASFPSTVKIVIFGAGPKARDTLARSRRSSPRARYLPTSPSSHGQPAPKTSPVSYPRQTSSFARQPRGRHYLTRHC